MGSALASTESREPTLIPRTILVISHIQLRNGVARPILQLQRNYCLFTVHKNMSLSHLCSSTCNNHVTILSTNMYLTCHCLVKIITAHYHSSFTSEYPHVHNVCSCLQGLFMSINIYHLIFVHLELLTFSRSIHLFHLKSSYQPSLLKFVMST